MLSVSRRTTDPVLQALNQRNQVIVDHVYRGHNFLGFGRCKNELPDEHCLSLPPCRSTAYDATLKHNKYRPFSPLPTGDGRFRSFLQMCDMRGGFPQVDHHRPSSMRIHHTCRRCKYCPAFCCTSRTEYVDHMHHFHPTMPLGAVYVCNHKVGEKQQPCAKEFTSRGKLPENCSK